MGDSISVISERLIPRRPASNLHPATAFTTSGCTDTAAAFRSTPGRRHRAHVSDSLISNAVEPRETHGPVIDVQQLRYRSLDTGLCGPNRAAHPKQRCLFLRRKGETWLWAVVPNCARKPRDGVSPRDLAPASRRRATAMPDPTAAPFAARCNPGRVRWLVGLRKTSSAELQNAEFPAGRNHRLQTGNR